MEDVSHSHSSNSHSYADAYSEARSFVVHLNQSPSQTPTLSTATRPNTHLQFQIITLIPKHLRLPFILHSTRWQNLLCSYLDSSFPQLLADIANFDAWIGYEGLHVRIWSFNHMSTHRISKQITKNIQSELSHGHLLEIQTFLQFFVISPLRAVKKWSSSIHTG